jgi:hypothetical protein
MLMAGGKRDFQFVFLSRPCHGQGRGIIAFGGMPETSVARGRAGGGLAPQEGFSLQKINLSTAVFLFNLSCFFIFLVFSTSTALGMTGLQRLKVRGFAVIATLKVRGFAVIATLKVRGFAVLSTPKGEGFQFTLTHVKSEFL